MHREVSGLWSVLGISLSLLGGWEGQPSCPQEQWLQARTTNWEDFAGSSAMGTKDLQEAQVPPRTDYHPASQPQEGQTTDYLLPSAPPSKDTSL